MHKANKFKKIIFDYLPTFLMIESKRMLPFMFSNSCFKKTSASLNITDRCNLRCVMCKQWKQENQKELTTQEWKEVINQLQRIGIKEINFTGGEPLLRKDIFDLIEYANSLKILCGLTTNGYFLTKDNIDILIDKGVKVFTLSIDALGDDYENIRGVQGSFAKVESAAKILSNIKTAHDISVNISFVLMKRTLTELPKVIGFCKELNLTLVICLLDKTPYLFDLEDQSELWIEKENFPKLGELQRLLFINKIKNNGLIFNTFADIDFLKEYFKDPIQKNMPCSVSQKRIFIDSNGNVFGGCWSMGKLGNVKDSKLADIILSKEYQKRHKKMFFKNCPGCSCGYSINLRYAPIFQMRSKIKSLFINNNKMRG